MSGPFERDLDIRANATVDQVILHMERGFIHRLALGTGARMIGKGDYYAAFHSGEEVERLFHEGMRVR